MKCTKKNILIGTVVVGLAAVTLFALFPYFNKPQVAIVEFDEARDMKPLLASFNDDWYWLIDAEPHEYSAYEAFHTRTPDIWDHQYEGKLEIKVLRDHGEFAGFVAYYPKNFYEGKVLYLNIAKDFRKKKYGEKLLKYAIKDLFDKGADTVSLVTRPTNEPALNLYKKAGMEEHSRNERYVYLKISKDKFFSQK